MSAEVPVSHGTAGVLKVLGGLPLFALWTGLAAAQVTSTAPTPTMTPRPPTALFEGPDVWRDGLELSRFTVWSNILKVHRVGSQVLFTYNLKNTTRAPIHFEGGGPAVVVRVKVDGREEERVVRPQREVPDLKPGYREFLQFVFRPDAVGRWHVSPTFVVGDHAAPRHWHELEFNIEPALERPRRPASQPAPLPTAPQRWQTNLGYCGDPGTLPHGLAVIVRVLGLKAPRVGDTLKVQYTYQNLFPNKPAVFGRKGVFVATRFTPKGKTEWQQRDFGHQLPYVVLRSYSPTRTIEFEESLLVDTAGTWVFWPSFDIDGDEAPERWCAVSVDVEE